MSGSNGGAKPPPPSVRCDRWFVRADNFLARVDGWMDRRLPPELNPLAQSGRAANLALLIAVVSGILMLFWYEPSIQFAHSSLEAIQGRTTGGWVRAMHRYSSDLVILLIAVHAARVFFARKFTHSRWLPWVSGVALLILIWFIGWTGYWLVWDQPAREIAISSMRVIDAIPIFGEPMSRLFVADRLVPSLLFFVVFFLHMLLPLLIGIGLIFHLARLNRVRLLPRWPLCLAIAAALGLVSFLIPAPLDAPAEMAVIPEHLTVDAWYLTPLALSLRLNDTGLWLVLALVLGIGFCIPWLLGRRRAVASGEDPSEHRTAWQTAVTESRCHACTQCVQDCPFDAVSMIPRSDHKPFPGRAWVDPSLCVGCAVCIGSCDSEAMNLPWFDLRQEEGRFETGVKIRLAAGEAVWVALVAGDIEGGLPYFQQLAWERRLPGYAVYVVPTASWVRPRLVEKLLKLGASGVLVVRDTRSEAAARDGNQWVKDRLEGTRKPALRAVRAGDNAGSWRVLDYNPAHPGQLRAEAAAFRTGGPEPAPVTPAATKAWPGFHQAAACGALLLAIMAAVAAPSHLRVANPVDPNPAFVLSFKVFGEPETEATIDPREEAGRPVHMRGRSTAKPRRSPVTVRLTVNGDAEERIFTGKGISRDGPAIGEWRLPLTSGFHEIQVEILPGPDADPLVWHHRFEARERRLHVLTHEPGDGFRWEDGDAETS